MLRFETPRPIARRLLCGILVVGCLFAAPTAARQERSAGLKRVLVVNSYEQGTVWTDAVVGSLREVLQGSEVPVDLWIEYLDVVRHSDPEHLDRRLDLLKDTLSQAAFDVVVTSDDAAAALVASHAETLFAGMPVVACGINDASLIDRYPANRVTSMLEVYDAAFMPALAARLRPGTSRFLVVTDNSSTGASVRQLYRDFSATRFDLTFEFLDGHERSLEEIAALVARAGPGDAILISNFQRDRDGRHYPRYAALGRIAGAASAPVYTTVLSSLGQGIMVGLENRGAQHGAWAGRQALRLLENPAASLERTVAEPQGRVVADAQALARWGIPLDRLPDDAILVNEPPSFYRANKQAVWTAAAIAAAQTLVIAALTVNIGRRRRAERALLSRTEHLERTLAELDRARVERAEIEERLRQGQRLEAIGRLAGGIAHDFNNLLTVILSYVELAEDTAPAGSPQAGHLKHVRVAASSAAELTRQILAFSRRQVLSPAIVDLNALVRESHGLVSRLLSEEVEIRLSLAEPLPCIKVDRAQMQQVLINLAVNARDAMSGRGRLAIETRVADEDAASGDERPTMPAGRYVVLTVSDTGSGMPPEVLEHIFDPFFTTKPKGRGTGLGLASVYGTVKQSGGWIWASSEVGQGTTFSLYFPAAGATSAEKEAASAGAVVTVPLPCSVLVVDDEQEILHVAAETLRAAGCDVVEASSVGEARHRLGESGRLDLVVTDVLLPGGTGRTVATFSRERFPHVRVLYVSGYTDVAIEQAGLAEADATFLAKPFTPRGLLERVAVVLDGHRPPAG